MQNIPDLITTAVTPASEWFPLTYREIDFFFFFIYKYVGFRSVGAIVGNAYGVRWYVIVISREEYLICLPNETNLSYRGTLWHFNLLGVALRTIVNITSYIFFFLDNTSQQIIKFNGLDKIDIQTCLIEVSVFLLVFSLVCVHTFWNYSIFRTGNILHQWN